MVACQEMALASKRREARLGDRWRENFQAELLRDRHHAWDVLLLLRGHRADLFKESFEASGGDDAEEPAGSLAEVTISVRHAARRKNGGAFRGDKSFAANGPFVIAFEDLERLIFAM